MNDDIGELDSVFLAPGDFPMLEGQRMCPRCKCCSVGVAPYNPPDKFPAPGIVEIRFVPEAASLLSQPSGNGDEAWFCKGGCNRKGAHVENQGSRERHPPSPSLIGRVKRAS